MTTLTAAPSPLTTPGSIGLLLYPLLLDQQQEHPGLILQHRFAPTPDIVQAVLAGQAAPETCQQVHRAWRAALRAGHKDIAAQCGR